jgi:hypothetical protein
MELTPQGSTYRATENEFLKLDDPDVHFTDVIEAPDGSLLVLNTGGWFRLGCPSSLMAKPDVMGSILRIRATGKPATVAGAWQTPYQPPGKDPASLLTALEATDPQLRLRALARIAEIRPESSRIRKGLLGLMPQALDAPTEHALIHAAQNLFVVHDIELLRQAESPTARRRLLASYQLPVNSYPPAHRQAVDAFASFACTQLDAEDAALGAAALKVLTDHYDAKTELDAMLLTWPENSALTVSAPSAKSPWQNRPGLRSKRSSRRCCDTRLPPSGASPWRPSPPAPPSRRRNGPMSSPGSWPPKPTPACLSWTPSGASARRSSMPPFRPSRMTHGARPPSASAPWTPCSRAR